MYNPNFRVFAKAGTGCRTTSVLIAAACIFCLEPKTGEKRPRNVTPSVKDDAVRGAAVGVRNDDVKVAGGVESDVCGGAGW